MKFPFLSAVAALSFGLVATSCSRPEQQSSAHPQTSVEQTKPAAPKGWQTDFSAALAEAAKENKPVLLNFTGSDWCTFCIQLDKETFSQPAFKEYAGKNLILVELDFPNRKMQSDQVIQQNQYLQQRYGVEGFPTLILLSPQGKELARNMGYLPGGPAGLIAWVQAAEKK